MFDVIKDTLAINLIGATESNGIPLWSVFLFLIVFYIFNPLITAFLITKSKNIAQKQDIEELTRKTETVKSEFIKHVEFLKHEHSLINYTYKLFVENIIEYYSMFYQHYMRCSRTTNHDLYTPKEGIPEDTSDIFEAQLEEFSINWNNQLGLIKILLPDTLLDLHKEVELLFNEFRDIVMKRKNYLIDPNIQYAFKPEYKEQLLNIFMNIDNYKNRMEKEIRTILKVNKLKGYT